MQHRDTRKNSGIESAVQYNTMTSSDTFKDRAARTTAQAAQQVTSVYTFALNQPSWLTRLIALLLVIALFAIVFFIVLPIIIVVMLAFALLILLNWVYLRCRQLLGLERQGRRNVRVISHQ